MSRKGGGDLRAGRREGDWESNWAGDWKEAKYVEEGARHFRTSSFYDVVGRFSEAGRRFANWSSGQWVKGRRRYIWSDRAMVMVGGACDLTSGLYPHNLRLCWSVWKSATRIGTTIRWFRRSSFGRLFEGGQVHEFAARRIFYGTPRRPLTRSRRWVSGAEAACLFAGWGNVCGWELTGLSSTPIKLVGVELGSLYAKKRAP